MDRSIEWILRKKGTDVVAVGPNATVREAVHRMNEAHTGSVLVVEEGSLLGIFTERDVLQRIAERRRDVEGTRVRDVMSRDPLTVAPQATVGRTLGLMTERRVRHLPVVREGQILGVVSIGDLVWSITADLRHEVHDLHNYIHGPVSEAHS